MTLFSSILAGLGLSQSEAAAFLNVRLDTVKSWGAGRNPVPDFAWEQLHALTERQRGLAEGIYEAWREGGEPDEIEIGFPPPDWPCDGAAMAAIRRAWELIGPDVAIHLVPPGSTPATKAARDIRKLVSK